MINMVCIQETKMANITTEKCQVNWGDTNIGWVHNETENGVGGILSIWSNSKFILRKSIINKVFIVIEGEWGDSKQTITIVNVYSPRELNKRMAMWEEISKCRKDDNNKVWCMVGDFNAIRNPKEMIGLSQSSGNLKEMAQFNLFIDNVDLLHIPMIGRKYMWYITNGTAKNILDRILVSHEWLELWPKSEKYVLDRTILDHCALVCKNS